MGLLFTNKPKRHRAVTKKALDLMYLSTFEK